MSVVGCVTVRVKNNARGVTVRVSYAGICITNHTSPYIYNGIANNVVVVVIAEMLQVCVITNTYNAVGLQ